MGSGENRDDYGGFRAEHPVPDTSGTGFKPTSPSEANCTLQKHFRNRRGCPL